MRIFIESFSANKPLPKPGKTRSNSLEIHRIKLGMYRNCRVENCEIQRLLLKLSYLFIASSTTIAIPMVHIPLMRVIRDLCTICHLVSQTFNLTILLFYTIWLCPQIGSNPWLYFMKIIRLYPFFNKRRARTKNLWFAIISLINLSKSDFMNDFFK